MRNRKQELIKIHVTYKRYFVLKGVLTISRDQSRATSVGVSACCWQPARRHCRLVSKQTFPAHSPLPSSLLCPDKTEIQLTFGIGTYKIISEV